MSLKKIFQRAVFLGLSGLAALSFNCTSRQNTTECKYDPEVSHLLVDVLPEKISERPSTSFFQGRADEVMERNNKVLMQTSDSLLNWFFRLDYLRGKSLNEQVWRVNDIVNEYVTYAPDSVLYKVNEYWAAPLETILAHEGDCEDFAFLKYAAFLYLKFPMERVSVALTDSVPGSHITHAVMLVDLSSRGDGTDIRALDNGKESSPHPLSGYWPKYVFSNGVVKIAARTDDARFFNRAWFAKQQRASLASRHF